MENNRIGGERGRIKTNFDMTHLIPSNENKKQTAVEWLFDYMNKNQYFIGNDLLESYNKALQMEKEQLAEKDKEIERLRNAIELCSGSCHSVLSNH